MDPQQDPLKAKPLTDQRNQETTTSPEPSTVELNQTSISPVPAARPTVFTPEVIAPTTTTAAASTPYAEPDFKVGSTDGFEPQATVPFAPSALSSTPSAATTLGSSLTIDPLPATPVGSGFATNQSVPGAVPTSQPQPTMFAQDATTLPLATLPPKKNRKKLVIIGGTVGMMLLLVATGVFGFYLPNRPSAVWNTGISRTGIALNSVVESATEKKALETLKTSKITGDLTATLEDVTYTGQVSSTFKDQDSTSGLDFSMKSSEDDMKISFKTLTKTVRDSPYPDAYVQFSGLKELGILDLFAPGLNQYEGKWISIPATTYQEFAEKYVGEDTSTANFTSADVAELARTTVTVTNDYLFSTDPEKAVLEQKSFVGKESVDGLSTYHYKVGINAKHATDYCVALATELTKTKAFKNITGVKDEEIKAMRDEAVKSCKENSTALEEIKDDEFDVWIDSKYKLLYKVRVSDKQEKGTYSEYGQRYSGGDELKFFVNYHADEDKYDVKVEATYNSKTFVTSLAFNADGKEDGNEFAINGTMKFEPSNDEVKIAIPKDAVPLETVLQQMGIAPPERSDSLSPNRDDINERQT